MISKRASNKFILLLIKEFRNCSKWKDAKDTAQWLDLVVAAIIQILKEFQFKWKGHVSIVMIVKLTRIFIDLLNSVNDSMLVKKYKSTQKNNSNFSFLLQIKLHNRNKNKEVYF